MKQKKYLFALILLLYPLRHCYIGLDLMDSGYALGNYRFYDTMNETWKLATYLANVVGMLLTHLPFGNTWIGMNIYTGLLIGIVAACTYLFLVNLQPKENNKELLLFIAELGALSLCWAPSVILYHYLGYILMTVAIMVLYTAIIKNNTGYYMIAGVILGLCVAVRMPNITYMAFILPLWYYCFIHKQNAVKRTLLCIGGYLIGVMAPIGYIELRYGIESYPDMIKSLFGMTETATDYKPTSMLTAMFGDYITYSGWLMLFLIYTITGVIFFKILGKLIESTNKITYIFKGLYMLGFLVVLRFCYGRGMFGIDFTDNFSIYKWLVVYLLMVILLCIWAIGSRAVDDGLKLWAVFLLVAIFVTPLGSNNALYPIINNLFFVAPVSVLIVIEFFGRGNMPFSVRTTITSVMICVFVVALLYGINFVFHDEAYGEKRVSVSFKCDNASNGMLTSYPKKEDVESLDTFIYESGLNDKSLLTYGNIPALSYIFNMEPAIYTTWPDLDSNSISRFKDDLVDIRPLIILGTDFVDNISEQGSTLAVSKLEIIEEFIDENNYIKVYENSTFRVYNTK